jgi:hypothetical protein
VLPPPVPRNDVRCDERCGAGKSWTAGRQGNRLNENKLSVQATNHAERGWSQIPTLCHHEPPILVTSLFALCDTGLRDLMQVSGAMQLLCKSFNCCTRLSTEIRGNSSSSCCPKHTIVESLLFFSLPCSLHRVVSMLIDVHFCSSLCALDKDYLQVKLLHESLQVPILLSLLGSTVLMCCPFR